MKRFYNQCLTKDLDKFDISDIVELYKLQTLMIVTI